MTVAGVFVMYASVLVHSYGLKDDYTYLAGAHGFAGAGTPEPQSSTQLGRPLFGLLTEGLYEALPHVGSLWVARAISVLGIAFFGVVLSRVLLPLVGERWKATVLALFVCSLPPFQVYAGWAVLFCVPYSAALAGLAALLVASASSRSGGARVRRLAGGGGLLFVALATYQPTAMAFWVCLLMLVLARRRSEQAVRQLARDSLIAAVPAMVGSFLLLKIGVWTLGAASATRSGIVTDVAAKLRWVPQPFGLALNLFVLPQRAVVAVLVALIVVAGVFLICRDCRPRERLVVVALAALAVPLSYAPNLLSQENYATYRTVGPLTALFALLAALACIALERNEHARRRRLAARGVLIGVAALSVILGARNEARLIVTPQSREWTLVRREVAQLPPGAATVRFLAPTENGGPITTPYGVRDEFAVPSTASTWADPSITWLAAKEEHRLQTAHLRVYVTVVGKPAAGPRAANVIDMTSLPTFR